MCKSYNCDSFCCKMQNWTLQNEEWQNEVFGEEAKLVERCEGVEVNFQFEGEDYASSLFCDD